MTEHPRAVAIDVSQMPRLGRAPLAHSADQAQAYGLDRHPSLEDVGRRTLLWNPELHEAYAGLTNYLRSSTRLSARDKEIAILRHAWDCGADYQWGMHAEMALDAGLTRSEVARLATELEDGDWASHEAAIIRAVDELHVACRISDVTWGALVAHYDEGQLIEILALVGSYRLLAYILGAVGIRPPGGTSPDLEGNSFLFTGHPDDRRV